MAQSLSALGTFLCAAQEGGRDVSVLRGWLREEGASSAGPGDGDGDGDGDDAARLEAAVQELGRRLRSADGAFAAGFAACSEALQRRVLGVVDLLGQALR
eukprot:gene26865-32466_t